MDVTGNFDDRLLECELTDNAGKESDEITFTVDDRDFAVQLPQRGDIMDVAIGYEDTGLVDKGQFEVSDVSGRGPPYTITVHGKSASQRDDQKSHRITNYQNKTLPDVVNDIAQRHGLTPQVGSGFEDINWTNHNQDKESDWHLLQRHSRSFDATFAVKNQTLIFNPASSGSNASGQSMPTLELDITDILEYEFKQGDRPKHKTVKASWYDRTKGQRVHEQVDIEDSNDGSSTTAEATHHVRHLHYNQAHAQHAAKGRAAKLQRAEASIDITITGDPTVAAEGTMIIDTGREGLDGEWTIKTVVHTYSEESYRTKITGEAMDSVGGSGAVS